MIDSMKPMPQIEKYRFGKMVVDGKPVTSDLMIFPDGRIHNNWRRNKGHFLSYTDIIPLLEAKPDVLIVGTGAFGMMKIDPSLSRQISEAAKGTTIPIIGMRTAKARDEYHQQIKSGKKVCACFHLTC